MVVDQSLLHLGLLIICLMFVNRRVSVKKVARLLLWCCEWCVCIFGVCFTFSLSPVVWF